MATLLSIGEFARLTHLSIKALRHYDDLGLVVPTRVDPNTGYRTYAAAEAWLDEALRSLEAELARADAASGGPFGALYPPEFFSAHRGEITAFVPLAPHPSTATPTRAELPELLAAVMVHTGSFADLDT